MKKPHIARLRRIQQQIREHSKTHAQDDYHNGCGTAHCVAGWAQVHKGVEPAVYQWMRPPDIFNDAAQYLQLTDEQAQNLFAPNNSTKHVHELINRYCSPEYRKNCR